MQQRSGGYLQNVKTTRKKIRISILGSHFLGAWGRGIGLRSISNLDDPRNGLKNLWKDFGNDRSNRLGRV